MFKLTKKQFITKQDKDLIRPISPRNIYLAANSKRKKNAAAWRQFEANHKRKKDD
jgi:hypothetical protein